MKDEYYENLAQTCISTINDPHTHIPSLHPYLKHKDDITLTSLYKVFTNIIPLYKIKIKEDKIQHKKEFIKLHTFEKNLYESYRMYVKTINTSESVMSYRIAVYLLALDHFNFSDVIVEKVFRGCNKQEVRELCADAITKKLVDDGVGEMTFKIVLCMLEFKWCDDVYKGIGCVSIIDKLTVDDIKITREEKQAREIIDANEKKKLKNNRKKCEKGNVRSKADKKTDKEMAKIEKALKVKKEKDVERETTRMLAKIVDNIMRIYFIILDEKKESLYEYCYRGLVNYKRFIAFEFKEGLYLYLGVNVLQGRFDVRLKCIEVILSVYGSESFEFKPVLISLFELLTPLKYNYTNEQMDELVEYLRVMLVEKRQSTKTVSAFVIRMFQFMSLRHFDKLHILTNRVISSYKIDVYDYEIVHDAVYSIENDNFDTNGALPYYGANILKRLI